MNLEDATRQRPQPPEETLDPMDRTVFVPAKELAVWTYDTFINGGGILENEGHIHLRHAHVGFLWTNCANSKHGNVIVGTAEIPNVQGGRWQKARNDYQLRNWFGTKPDFLITLFAPYAAEADDASFCSMLEHELYHCGQARDADGELKFRKSGMPCFCLKGHDVEEHCGVTERYGAGASAGKTAELVRLANAGPTIAEAKIAFACGTCLR